MPIMEELDKQGQFLFKYRSFIPALVVLISFFFLNDSRYPYENYSYQLGYLSFCFLISFIGLVIRSLTIGYVPKNTSGRNRHKQVADVLNQTGLYSILRHPLYLGNFLMHSGVALIPRNFVLFCFFILVFCFYYERIILTEENFLRKKFGDKYLLWANRTPAFIPSFKNFKSSENLFSFKTVIHREYSSFLGLVLIFLFFDILIYLLNYVKVENFSFDLIPLTHKIIFSSVWVIYFLFRFLAKKTNLFVEQGR